jgi:3-hydroxybutyryl-CoA dehydrogenase
MDIKSIGIVGAGVMGGGIAQMLAENGMTVLLADIDREHAETGIAAIRKRLSRSADKGKITSQRVEEVMERIQPAASLVDFSSVDLAIEAATEDSSAKGAIYTQLVPVLSESAILATNTSCLSVEELAALAGCPERFMGIHFFNPPTKLELVEVAATSKTDPAIMESVKGLLTKCGKQPIQVKDSHGFIVNRLLLLMINEAAKMVDEGVASVEDIDTAMQLGALHPAGPLYVADLIGLDTCEKALDILHSRSGNAAFAPAPIIRKRVAEGKLGRKTGGGFYSQ